MTTPSYRTLDRSLIVELIRPETEGCEHLSVAEAAVMPGESTLLHYHRSSEEVYYVLAGSGLLLRNAAQIELVAGGAHLIRPGDRHRVVCMGAGPLRILCLCSPPYQHEDTVIAEQVVT